MLRGYQLGSRDGSISGQNARMCQDNLKTCKVIRFLAAHSPCCQMVWLARVTAEITCATPEIPRNYLGFTLFLNWRHFRSPAHRRSEMTNSTLRCGFPLAIAL